MAWRIVPPGGSNSRSLSPCCAPRVGIVRIRPSSRARVCRAPRHHVNASAHRVDSAARRGARSSGRRWRPPHWGLRVWQVYTLGWTHFARMGLRLRRSFAPPVICSPFLRRQQPGTGAGFCPRRGLDDGSAAVPGHAQTVARCAGKTYLPGQARRYVNSLRSRPKERVFRPGPPVYTSPVNSAVVHHGEAGQPPEAGSVSCRTPRRPRTDAAHPFASASHCSARTPDRGRPGPAVLVCSTARRPRPVR